MSKIIETNFSPVAPIRIENLRLYISVFIVVAIICLVFLAFGVMDVNRNIRNVDVQIATLKENYQKVNETSLPLPDYAVMHELGRKVKLVNDLVRVVGDNTATILAVIENDLPKNALITRFAHKTKAGEIDITVKSTDTLALTAFVHDLEINKKFYQVLIRRQSHDKADAAATSYDIRIIQKNGK